MGQSSRRILSVWLPNFATERLTVDNLTVKRPLVLTRRVQGRELLVAVDSAAAAGLLPGLPLVDARAILPGLAVLPHDPEGDARALRRLARWCALLYSPWAAPCGTAEGRGGGPGGAGGLLLDITGCAHLFAGGRQEKSAKQKQKGQEQEAAELALAHHLLGRLAGFGFTARLGLAESLGAAWALARFATGARDPVAAAPPGGARAALRSLSPAALRLPDGTVELMARFGLDRIARLLALPRASLTARFGGQVARRLAQALGEEGEAVSPLAPPAPYRCRESFAEPVSSEAPLAAALARLLAVLCRQLAGAGEGARRLTLTCLRVDGSWQDLTRGTSRPNRDPAALAALFREALGEIDPGFGIEALVLAVPVSEPFGPRQLALPTAVAGDPQKREGPAALVDRLSAVLGPDKVGWLRAGSSHLPERAQRRAAGLAPRAAPAEADWPKVAPRPFRLLGRPEPIEVMGEVDGAAPDGSAPGTFAPPLAPCVFAPPAVFRWRRCLLRVAAAEGPERIAAEWWDPDTRIGDAPPRDYFRIEDPEGRRYWIYHAAGRWYLQGLFG